MVSTVERQPRDQLVQTHRFFTRPSRLDRGHRPYRKLSMISIGYPRAVRVKYGFARRK
ncbi:hypothetical protein JYU34_004439 [Plutella xylostella]|uniref:Uncharacterized protein n=1 Tax=Plutella xylostella TaxID=51655 RepID=A0ABQ7QXZ9_PLUXY|nr:hypothetical protein JYU34_004439 [Plutella xylostella]